LRSFEVQTRRSGHWKTDSTYDNRELAELRARQIDANDRADPVRVVEEVYQERTKKYQLRTIYRGKGLRTAPSAQTEESLLTRSDTAVIDRPKDSNDPGASRPPNSKKEPARAKGSDGSADQRRGSSPPKGGALGAWALLGLLVLLVGLGIGAMIALEYYLTQS